MTLAKPSIAVIATGGTIASKRGKAWYSTAWIVERYSVHMFACPPKI